MPNPGASIFPGRRGASDNGALAAAGRDVIGKTLALMDATPSQEEQKVADLLALFGAK